jgi:hypothetical protein
MRQQQQQQQQRCLHVLAPALCGAACCGVLLCPQQQPGCAHCLYFVHTYRSSLSACQLTHKPST